MNVTVFSFGEASCLVVVHVTCTWSVAKSPQLNSVTLIFNQSIYQSLVVVQTFTSSTHGTRYCNEILLSYVRLFRGAMGLQFLFMDDNAPCHRTVADEQLLESEDIERMDWPARSPDLNPIEQVWDFLGRRLAARTLQPVTIRELRLAL
ncbi:transposable element Tcb2 transposase [Trichonephila clavipes]|nr:transposable element Tcb2 transposase [Trichonephila clavipes]